MEKTLIEKYIDENGEFIATPVGTSMWPMPVSYTHLDVYKRQGYRGRSAPVLIKSIDCLESIGF